MDSITRLVRRRNRILAAAAFSFLIWQGATLALDIGERVGPIGPDAMLPMQLALIGGAVMWAATMLFFADYARRVKRAGAGAVIQDELFRHNRAIATRLGFAAMIFVACALLAVVTFVEFSAAIAVRTVLIAGVSVPLVTSAILGREEAGQEA